MNGQSRESNACALTMNYMIRQQILNMFAVWMASRGGAVYTIREVFIDPFEDNVQVRLAEIWRPQAPEENTGIEAGYRIERFRPLITKTQEQDVEMFLRLASPSPLERLDRLAEEFDSLYND